MSILSEGRNLRRHSALQLLCNEVQSLRVVVSFYKDLGYGILIQAHNVLNSLGHFLIA
jgi:hypothetical protein